MLLMTLWPLSCIYRNIDNLDESISVRSKQENPTSSNSHWLRYSTKEDKSQKKNSSLSKDYETSTQ